MADNLPDKTRPGRGPIVPEECPLPPNALAAIVHAMLAAHQIASCNVAPAFEASIQCGVLEAELSAQLGWTRELFRSADTPIEGESTYEHFEWMYQRPNYGKFVLTAVTRHTAASLGVVGLACKTARTVGEAISCHARYQALTNTTTRYQGRTSRLGFELQDLRQGKDRLGRWLVSEYTLLVAIHLLRTLVGRPLVPRHLFTGRAAATEDLRHVCRPFLGCAMEFREGPCSLVLAPELLETPLPTADRELSDYFARVLRSSVSPDGPPEAFSTTLRRTLAEGLSRGETSLAQLAERVGASARTIQRRLEQEGLNFAQLLSDTRREAASHYLRDTDMSQAEIAYLLGYTEPASFFRAFRKWFDSTPERMRHQWRSSEIKV